MEDLFARRKRIEAFFSTVSNSLHLPEIARILGAEEFLSIMQKRSGTVFVLDVKSFLEKCDRRGKAPRPPLMYRKIDAVMLPPDTRERPVRKDSDGEQSRQHRLFCRAQLLTAVLDELDADYFVVEGTNAPEMMRPESYRVFVVEKLHKMIFVNDGEGEATFVVHESTDWVAYRSKRKSELELLGNCTRIVWPGEEPAWISAVYAELVFGPAQRAVPADAEAAQRASGGIVSIYSLAQHLGKTPALVDQLARALAAALFGEESIAVHVFEARTWNFPTLHVSAVMAEILRKQYPPVPKAGDFTPVTTLARRFHRQPEVIVELAELMCDEHGKPRADHIQERKAHNLPVMCLSPQLAALVTQRLADPSWISLSEIVTKTALSAERVRELAANGEAVFAANGVPEKLAGEFYSRMGHDSLFVDPRLYDWIVSQLVPSKPEDWRWLNEFGDVRTSMRLVKSVVASKSWNLADHFQLFRGMGGNRDGRVAVSPQLYREMRIRSSSERPSVACKLPEELAQQWNVTVANVYQILREFDPKWTSNRSAYTEPWGLGKTFGEYLRPEVIERLEEIRRERRERRNSRG